MFKQIMSIDYLVYIVMQPNSSEQDEAMHNDTEAGGKIDTSSL